MKTEELTVVRAGGRRWPLLIGLSLVLAVTFPVPQLASEVGNLRFDASYLFDGGSVYFKIAEAEIATNTPLCQGALNRKEVRIVVVKPRSSLHRKLGRKASSTPNMIFRYVADDPASPLDADQLKPLDATSLQIFGKIFSERLKLIKQENALSISEEEKGVLESLISVLKSGKRVSVWGADAEELIRRGQWEIETVNP